MADTNKIKGDFGFEKISELAKLLKANDLGEIAIKDGDFSITIKSKVPPVCQSAPPIAAAIATNAIVSTEDSTKEITGNIVKSPIVGTFYSSSAPDKPPFVTVGQAVKKGDILFIIESMKLMNEIQSDFDGTVKELLTSDGQGVEFHQPIMIIE